MPVGIWDRCIDVARATGLQSRESSRLSNLPLAPPALATMTQHRSRDSHGADLITRLQQRQDLLLAQRSVNHSQVIQLVLDRFYNLPDLPARNPGGGKRFRNVELSNKLRGSVGTSQGSLLGLVERNSVPFSHRTKP